MIRSKQPVDRRKLLNIVIFFLAVMMLMIAAVQQRFSGSKEPALDFSLAEPLFDENQIIHKMEFDFFTVEKDGDGILITPPGILTFAEAKELFTFWQHNKVLPTEAPANTTDAKVHIKITFTHSPVIHEYYIYSNKERFVLYHKNSERYYHLQQQDSLF